MMADFIEVRILIAAMEHDSEDLENAVQALNKSELKALANACKDILSAIKDAEYCLERSI